MAAKATKRKKQNDSKLPADLIPEDNRKRSDDTEPPPVERHDSGTEEESHDEGHSPSVASEKSAATSKAQKLRRSMSFLAVLLRTLFLESPLALLFAIYVSMLVFTHVHDEYLLAQMELMTWSEERAIEENTYYHRECDAGDLTATSVEELVIGPNATTEDAVNHHLVHGVSVFPDLLPDDLLDELREFLISQNEYEEGWYVIEPEHRWSYGVGANMHPSVAEALKQIAVHPTMRPFLEGVAGKNPSIIEFTAITSEYGAAEQFYHSDVLPHASATKNVRSMIPSYSLFIPLQDTTAAMGATHVCPGSHVCSVDPDYCMEHGFQVSGEQDLWKKGTAFVFNQAFYHCGMGHSDPNGKERVAFIITFAPRPRFREGELETRFLSIGGSYSLRWDHWGHTLDDLAEADTAMANPWLTLKALGLYKPANSDWGWDMISVASFRITNYDNGYKLDHLEDFLEKGGFPFLPRFLQGSMNLEETDEEELWYTFLKETFHLCKQFVIMANAVFLGLYLGSVALMDVVRYCKRTSNSDKPKRYSFPRAVGRLLVMYGLVALLGHFAVVHVDNTQWARQIKSGKLYRLPLAEKSSLSTEVTLSPGTLPNINDVLISLRYNSDYLASYNDYINVGHPANAYWKDMIAEYSHGYHSMPRVMQDIVSKAIVTEIREEDGRFLTQHYVRTLGRWSEMSGADAERQTRRELLMASNPFLKVTNSKLEHLYSETKFGARYDTNLNRAHIPALLTKLQKDLLAEHDVVEKPVGKPSAKSLGPAFRLPQMSFKPSQTKTRSPVPKFSGAGQEPYEGAWLKEGDVVEGMYNGKYPEWYKGEVEFANAWKSTYDLNYDDGDDDSNLCRTCVRPFVPYAVGEQVEAKLHQGEDVYYPVKVSRIHPDGTIDVRSDESGASRNRVGLLEVRRGKIDDRRLRRRTALTELDVGAMVDARFQGASKEWFRGTIRRVRKDGTFDVEFNDGDYEEEIEKVDIRLAVS